MLDNKMAWPVGVPGHSMADIRTLAMRSLFDRLEGLCEGATPASP